MKNNSSVYIVILVLAFLVLAGFYFVFDKLSGLETDVKNVELNYQLAAKDANANSPAATSTPAAGNNSGNTAQNPPSQNQTSSDIVVPTGIIFSVNSSPTLQPQTSVTVTIDNVAKHSDGSILVTLKAFTNQAASYSAIDPSTFIQYISLNSSNQMPMNASSAFSSMPPKSVVTGTVTFTGDPAKTTAILQVGQGDNQKFYEINFSAGTYKETAIG